MINTQEHVNERKAMYSLGFKDAIGQLQDAALSQNTFYLFKRERDGNKFMMSIRSYLIAFY
jgi:hypothetical protein